MAEVSALGSRRAFLAGTTGSGKSEFLRRYFLTREPRLLIADNTGEWRRHFPRAEAPAFGLEATLEQLRRVAGRSRWTVIAALEPRELGVLATRLLVPWPDIRAGYAYAVGGMALALDEVDLVIPGTAPNAPAATLWRRGRHARLSVYAATQRPGSVNKEVSALAEWIAILRLDEPNDVTYLGKRFGRELFAWGLAYAQRVPHGVFLYHTVTGTGRLIDAAGRVIETRRRGEGGARPTDL